MKITIEDEGVSVTVEVDDKMKLLQVLARAASFVSEAPVIAPMAEVVPEPIQVAVPPGPPAATSPPKRRKRRTQAQIASDRHAQVALDNAAQAWSDGALAGPTDEVMARAKALGLPPPPPPGTPDVTSPPAEQLALPETQATAFVTEEVTEEPQKPDLRVVPEPEDNTVTKNIISVTAEDFEGVGKRRDIVRTIMKKGVTELPDIIQVCESLKGEVKLLGMLGDIPPAITAAFEAVQAENSAS